MTSKPYADYPLTPHVGGRWQKKILGKIHYFGRWVNRVKGKMVRMPDVLANAGATDAFLMKCAAANSGNKRPVAVDESDAVAEDGVLSILAEGGVLNNDTETDGAGALEATSVSGPTHGGVPLHADGTYTPDADFNGTDDFTCTANDGLDDLNVATVTITVDQLQDGLPVADAGGPYNVVAAGDVTVGLRVTDSGNQQSTSQATITIEDSPVSPTDEYVWDTVRARLFGSAAFAGVSWRLHR